MNILNTFSSFSVDDLAKAKEFYTHKLGLELKDEQMGLNVILPGGGAVHIYDKPDHRPADFTVLNLVVESIDSVIDELVGRGVVFEKYENLPASQDDKGVLRGLSSGYGPDIAWFKDPAGNIISVLQVS